MRRTLGTLLATTTLLLATGCGSEPGPTADDASSSPSEPELVAILAGTAAGGETSETAEALDTPAGVDRLVATITRDSFAAEVRAKVQATEVPDTRRLFGAVVSVGCDEPVDATVFVDADGVRLEPVFESKPRIECFAAVTSVALVLVDA